ncbi:hypothetical protein [Actinophytocola sp.]|uniref:hypothetical protein n=1 Tax=Actinophytocola sp. TaxID=1872138 RepID=UPI003899FE97
MKTFLTALGSLLLFVLGNAVGSVLSKEVEGWLDQISFAILRLARWRLPVELREQKHDQEWKPELNHIIAELKERPLTRLRRGLCFATGLLWSARKIAREAGIPTLWARGRQAFAGASLRMKFCIYVASFVAVCTLVTVSFLLGAAAITAHGGTVPAFMSDTTTNPLIAGTTLLWLICPQILLIAAPISTSEQHPQPIRARRKAST